MKPFVKNIIFAWLLLVCFDLKAQWAGSTTMIMDGVANETSYQNSGSWNICWDDDSLFFTKTGGANNEPVIIYLDIDPAFPITGGSNSNGSVVGTTDYGVTANLPFRADVRIYWVVGSAPEYRVRDGSGGWTAGTNLNASEYGNSGADRELKIAWDYMPGLSSRPNRFNFFGYVLSTASPAYTYHATPDVNPNNGTFSNPNCEYYWRCNNTSSTGTANPFNFKCYTYLGSSGNLGYIADIYDFTLNKTATTITKNGLWVALGNMVIADGTIQFSSNADSLRIEDSLVVMSTGKFDMQNAKSIVWVKKSFTQKSSNSLDLSDQKEASVIVAGNFRVESQIRTDKTEIVFYDHKASQVLQTISGDLKNNNVFFGMEVNNGAGVALNVSDSLAVSDSFVFTNGIIQVPSGKFLKFRGNIAITNTGGPTSGKFVNGKLARQLNNTNDSVFHVGKGNIMARCAIQPSNASTDRVYIAEYIASSHQYSGSSSGSLVGSSGLDHASFVEYWEISCNQGGSNDDANITLFWTSNSVTSSSASDRTNLRVAHWNNSTSLWEMEGNSPIIADSGQNDGFIKANTATSDFSNIVFTIGSTVSANPLPVTLLFFEANRLDTHTAEITWKTASESNNKGFELYGSDDGFQFRMLQYIPSKAIHSNVICSYQVKDYSVGPSTNYYYLKQIDQDGKATTYPKVSIPAWDSQHVHIFPNPSNGNLQITTNIPEKAISSFGLYNHLGQKILDLPHILNQSISLAPGYYVIKIIANHQLLTEKLVVY